MQKLLSLLTLALLSSPSVFAETVSIYVEPSFVSYESYYQYAASRELMQAWANSQAHAKEIESAALEALRTAGCEDVSVSSPRYQPAKLEIAISAESTNCVTVRHTASTRGETITLGIECPEGYREAELKSPSSNFPVYSVGPLGYGSSVCVR